MNIRTATGIFCLCGLLSTQSCNNNNHVLEATVDKQIEYSEFNFAVAFKTDDGVYNARFAFQPADAYAPPNEDAYVKLYLNELKRSLSPGTKAKILTNYFDKNHIGIFDGKYHGNPSNRCPAIEIIQNK